MKSYRLPIRLVSTANISEHWGTRRRRTLKHQKAALIVDRHPLPCVVTITRVAPRCLDDHDNLRMSCKALVDGIAARLGVDDADERVEWRYRQDKGPHEAIVTIEGKR